MVIVPASHYRVFSVDPPSLPTRPYPGKMVPTGVITDAHHRQGFAYGRYLTDMANHICYITAKFCEEYAEYRLAPVKKRASEVADILTLIGYALPKLSGTALVPVRPCSMQHMESLWRSFLQDLLHERVLHPQLRMLNMVRRTQHVTETEIRREKLSFADMRKAQQAKAQRIGEYEGWVVTHLVLPAEDDFIPRLLASGWYECPPDGVGQFSGLEKADLITKDRLKTVTLG